MRIKVKSGKHERGFSPVTWRLEERLEKNSGEGILLDVESGGKYPFLWVTEKDKTVCTALLPYTLPEEEKIMEVIPEEKTERVLVAEEKDGEVNIKIGDKLFTSFHYSETWVRPFLFPVYSPSGKLLVRELIENKPEAEHPHHRGIWVAHGDVNGVDNWSEMEGHGYQIVKEINVTSGTWWSRIIAVIDWTDNSKKKNLEERRIITFFATSGVRFIDFEITFSTENEVKLGDTKEAGILSVRVNPSINASAKGIMENSWGGINEEEIWGKRAHWCDYSGPVDGEWWGVSIFDHPQNPHHPTHWHARNYGLMTANHYGLSYYFGNDYPFRGDLIIKEGEKLTYRYRVYIHPGNACSGKVKERYIDYASPPVIEIM
ncbi:PmoA family protein [Candidatus Calescamantes bacterium]|nr:PmoA family protein [Candidatus Calescamantes bacterium]